MRKLIDFMFLRKNEKMIGLDQMNRLQRVGIEIGPV